MATATNLQGKGRKGAFDTVAASQTDSVLVAAVANMKIRVHAFMINQGDAANAVTFNTKPAGAGTAISPALKYSINGGTTSTEAPSGWFETNRGEGLTVTTGATASNTGIMVVYSVVPA